MKKLVVLLLALSMTMFVFVSCGNASSEAEYISEDQAKEIALQQVEGATADEINSCVLNEEDDINKQYEITIMHDMYEYYVEIDAHDGGLFKVESETVTAGNQPADGEPPVDMGKAEIKKIALAEVEGALDVDVTKCLIHKDGEDYYYEVEIQYGGKKTTMNINATSGEILTKNEEAM